MIVAHIALTLQATRDGVGIANLLEDYVRTDLDDGRLVGVQENWCPPFTG